MINKIKTKCHDVSLFMGDVRMSQSVVEDKIAHVMDHILQN